MKFDLLKNIDQGGCSCKISASKLHEALNHFSHAEHPQLLVGINTHDDAGVFKINQNQALIQTVDFFPPMCSNPYDFGQIAAANALSDVYAMGGDVLTALNLIAFPSSYPIEILKEIMAGGASKVQESGGFIVGGHSIEDAIPKYGLAVTGMVHPEKIITNSDAKPGDVILLTKPIGNGIIMAASRLNMVSQSDTDAALQSMKQLNKQVAEIMQKNNIICATDITGFGLLGHALKIALNCKIQIHFQWKNIPFFNEVLKLAGLGCIPGAIFKNQEFCESHCYFNASLNYEQKMLLYDAQTSGGMLIFCPEKKANYMQQQLVQAGYPHTAIIGFVEDNNKNAKITID